MSDGIINYKRLLNQNKYKRATAYPTKRQYQNYHCERYEPTGKKLCANGNVEGTVAGRIGQLQGRADTL